MRAARTISGIKEVVRSKSKIGVQMKIHLPPKASYLIIREYMSCNATPLAFFMHLDSSSHNRSVDFAQ